jgi:hypothetical protein
MSLLVPESVPPPEQALPSSPQEPAASSPLMAIVELSLRILRESYYDAHAHGQRRAMQESDVPLVLLEASRESPEAGEAAFVAYCKRGVCEYESACDAIHGAPRLVDIESFRELVLLYHALGTTLDIRDYLVSHGLLSDSKFENIQDLLRVRATPPTVVYEFVVRRCILSS